QLTFASPHADTTVSDSTIALVGSWRDSTFTTVTIDGDTIASGYGGGFNRAASNYPLDWGANNVVLRAVDRLGKVAQITRVVFRKPAGETGIDSLLAIHSAQPIDSTVATSFYDQVRFIFSGGAPLQVGLTSTNIDTTYLESNLVAVVRGKVVARDFGALPYVLVRVLNHPEYGSTQSRADGSFDLVVNGGGELTLRFTKSGYLESQRKVVPSANDYTDMGKIGMVGRSGKRNTIQFAAQSTTLGRFATDLNGDRKISML